MKKPSVDLFVLIHSMSKPEKRYFKLHAARHLSKDNQYAKLFTLIDTQAVYNEPQLTKHFAGKKSASHFAVVKKQLYENILEALHRYDEFAHPEQKIYKGIHFCTLLLKKGLFDQCKKQIRKYKALAYSLEKFENIIELTEIEKRLITKMQFTSVSYLFMQQLQHEQNTCIHYLETTNKYWFQSHTIFKMHYEKKIGPGKENTELHNLIRDTAFTDYTKASTFKSKLDFLQINALHAFVSGDVSKAYQLNTQFIQLLDTHDHLKFLFADRYFSALNNYLIDSLLLKRYTELLAGILALRALPLKPEFRHIQNLEANVFRLSYLLEMNYYISTERFEEALQKVHTIQKGLKIFENKIALPNAITLHYINAYTLFTNKKFSGCLDELQVILHTHAADTITDIYRDTRMMQILCHFEMGDHMLVDSLIISMQRSLLSQKIKQQTHKIVIRFIKQSIQKVDKPPRADLIKKLVLLADNEKNVFNNFNYLYWAEKITGIS
ncbi:MAG: hypothetical protein H7X71_00570 [Chitinophagales bacterium]|nr:hypothetical protein [Chitinophagales bacterium]